jgi:hypothetical protein
MPHCGIHARVISVGGRTFSDMFLRGDFSDLNVDDSIDQAICIDKSLMLLAIQTYKYPLWPLQVAFSSASITLQLLQLSSFRNSPHPSTHQHEDPHTRR